MRRLLRAERASSRPEQAAQLLRQGENRVNEACRRQSVITGETPLDLINSFAKRVKSGMKALVVKVEYIANCDESKEPVMKLQVSKRLLSRTADESNEAQQTHLNQLPTRAELEPLLMSASGEETPPRALIFPNIDVLTAWALPLPKLQRMRNRNRRTQVATRTVQHDAPGLAKGKSRRARGPRTNGVARIAYNGAV